MLKVGLVGVGGISGAHIPAWEAMAEAELVALCDIRPEQMERYGDKHCYTDFDEMLKNESLDVVDICLPTYLHADYAVKAMEAGCHVLCEKPMSLKSEDVRRVYDTAARMGVNFMVAHVLRFWPEYEMVKEMYDSGRYGRLLSGHMTRISGIPQWSWDGWMQDESRSGFVPYDLHIHDLDYLVYAFGAPQAVKSSRVKRPDQDSFSVIYDYDGAFVSCTSAWYGGQISFQAGFRFQFEQAVVVCNGGGLEIYGPDGKLADSTTAAVDAQVLGLPTTDAYANEIRYFADCVLANRPADKVKPEELVCVIDMLNGL